MPPKRLPREEIASSSRRDTTKLPQDIVGVIASYLSVNIDTVRPLMLVNTTWYRGVIEQDGVKPKQGVHWPWCALKDRQPSSVAVSLLKTEVIASVRRALPEIQEVVVDGPVKEPAAAEQLAALPNLKSVQFLQCYKKTMAATIKRLEQLQHLQKLVFTNPDMKNTDVRAIAVNLTNLTSLKLLQLPWGTSYVTDAGLKHIGAHLGKLKELHLSCGRVSDRGVQSIVTGCKELTSLDLQGAALITDKAVEDIAANLTELQELGLASCKSISGVGVRHLWSLAHLRRLDLTACDKIENHEEPFLLSHDTSKQSVVSLHLRHTKLASNDGLRRLAIAFPHLEHLDVSGSTTLTDDGVYHLSQLKHLKTLNVSECPCLGNNGVATIAQSCPKLTNLDLQQARFGMKHAFITYDCLLHIANNLSKLKSLNIQGVIGFQHLAKKAISTRTELVTCGRRYPFRSRGRDRWRLGSSQQYQKFESVGSCSIGKCHQQRSEPSPKP